MNRTLVSEFKFVIKMAIRDRDYARAQLARETAFEKYDIDLLDYLVHPSMGKAA